MLKRRNREASIDWVFSCNVTSNVLLESSYEILQVLLRCSAVTPLGVLALAANSSKIESSSVISSTLVLDASMATLDLAAQETIASENNALSYPTDRSNTAAFM